MGVDAGDSQMMDAPSAFSIAKFGVATGLMVHVICFAWAKVIQGVQSSPLSTTPNNLLAENILKKTNCRVYQYNTIKLFSNLTHRHQLVREIWNKKGVS